MACIQIFADIVRIAMRQRTCYCHGLPAHQIVGSNQCVARQAFEPVLRELEKATHSGMIKGGFDREADLCTAGVGILCSGQAGRKAWGRQDRCQPRGADSSLGIAC